MSLTEQIHDSNTSNNLITGPEPGHPSFPHLPQPISSQPQPSCPLHLPLLHPVPSSPSSWPQQLRPHLLPPEPLPQSPSRLLSLPSSPDPPSLRGLLAPGAAPPLQWPSTLRTKFSPPTWCSRPLQVGPWAPVQPSASPCPSLTLCAFPTHQAASCLGPSSLLCLLPGHLPLHPPTSASRAPCLVLPHSDPLLHQRLVNRAQPPPGSPPSRLRRPSWCALGCFCRPWASLS